MTIPWATHIWAQIEKEKEEREKNETESLPKVEKDEYAENETLGQE